MSNEDHDVLIRIETKLDRALGDIRLIDGRVGSLEKGYWRIMGGVACIVIAINIVVKWMFK